MSNLLNQVWASILFASIPAFGVMVGGRWTGIIMVSLRYQKSLGYINNDKINSDKRLEVYLPPFLVK